MGWLWAKCVGFRLDYRYRNRLPKCSCYGSITTIFVIAIIVIVYRLFLRLSYRKFSSFDIQPYYSTWQVHKYTAALCTYRRLLVKIFKRDGNKIVVAFSFTQNRTLECWWCWCCVVQNRVTGGDEQCAVYCCVLMYCSVVLFFRENVRSTLNSE